MRTETNILSPVRQKRVLELVRSAGGCTVDFLARELGVSEMTVRRDLHLLAESGKLVRTHGGAASPEEVHFRYAFLNRVTDHAEAKQAIGHHAASLVRAGQTVMLDSGTTTLAVANALRECSGVRVVTTSLPIAAALQASAGVELLLLGGLLRRDSPDLEGGLTESNLDRLRGDVAFLGADGLDQRGNLYSSSISVARLLEKMASACTEVYIVADSSKIGVSALMRFGRLPEFKGLITDSAITADAHQSLRAAGASVLIAGQEGAD